MIGVRGAGTMSVARAMPASGWPALDWPGPEISTHTLPNGVRAILAENHSVPLVLVSWTASAGFDWDPPGLEGLASFVPMLLREGTARRGAGQITQEVDELGAELASGADWEYAFLNLGLLACDVAEGIDLLLDMACGPRFPDVAIARLRQRRLAEIDRQRRDARALANEVFLRALFGDTGCGRPPMGSVESVARIACADLETFHATSYAPPTSYVVVTGNIDRHHVLDLLSACEPSAASRQIPSPPPRARDVEVTAGIRIVNVPHAPQTEIRIGQSGVSRDSEHLPALEVLNAILGGGPTSRLTRSLRQHDGLTYDIRSRVAARFAGGMFVVETSVASDAASVARAGIYREIARLCDERVPEHHVEEAKRRVMGAELRRFQDLIGTGATLGQRALQRDAGDDPDRRREAMAAVDAEAIRAAARRYLDPARLVTVIAGPGDVLQTQFPSGGAQACELVPLESIS